LTPPVLQDRVDLDLVVIPVVVEVHKLLRPRDLTTELGKDEPLQQRTERRSRPTQRMGVDGQESRRDAGVDEHELRGVGDPAAQIS
jgi:hypothetical protein